jgi:hypothetical protein
MISRRKILALIWSLAAGLVYVGAYLALSALYPDARGYATADGALYADVKASQFSKPSLSLSKVLNSAFDPLSAIETRIHGEHLHFREREFIYDFEPPEI